MAVGVAVKLPGVARPVRLDVVASDNWKRNATDGVTGAIVAVLGAGLLAHIGGLRRAICNNRGRRGWWLCRSSGARGGNGLGSGGTTVAGLMVLPAVELIAVLAVVTGVAVLAKRLAPGGILIAVQAGGIASLTEAGADVELALLPCLETVCLAGPLGSGRKAPVTNLVLTLGRNDGSGSANLVLGSGRALRGGCPARLGSGNRSLGGGRLGSSVLTLGGSRLGGGVLALCGGVLTLGSSSHGSGVLSLGGGILTLGSGILALSSGILALGGGILTLGGGIGTLGSRGGIRGVSVAGAGLGRLEILGNVDIQTVAAAAGLGGVTTARCLAVRSVSLDSVGKKIATVAFV